MATGLAWTETGGDVLYIEASLLPEGEGLDLDRPTGRGHAGISSSSQQLSLVARRGRSGSMSLALSKRCPYPRAAGAIPKDGPSAGITMATALASLYLGLRSNRTRR